MTDAYRLNPSSIPRGFVQDIPLTDKQGLGDYILYGYSSNIVPTVEEINLFTKTPAQDRFKTLTFLDGLGRYMHIILPKTLGNFTTVTINNFPVALVANPDRTISINGVQTDCFAHRSEFTQFGQKILVKIDT